MPPSILFRPRRSETRTRIQTSKSSASGVLKLLFFVFRKFEPPAILRKRRAEQREEKKQSRPVFRVVARKKDEPQSVSDRASNKATTKQKKGRFQVTESRSIMLSSIFVALASLAVVFGAYAPDEITNLPGWNGNLPSKHYSGYLNVTGTGSHLHYYLAQSESNPATDPTVFWFNGGPGCSSMDGWAYEHGPFEISKDGSQLTLREYRWCDLFLVSLPFLLSCSPLLDVPAGTAS